jgi:hypothetical protein
MPEQSQLDLTLTIGANFEQTFTLFNDPRVKQWRGEYHEYFVYEPGEAVEVEPGEAFVALLKTMNAKPGAPGSEEFWAPLERQNLTGCEIELVCEDVFTLTEGHGITVNPTQGTITAEASPTQFADPPSSAHYYLKITDEGVVTFPRGGTMLFKPPGAETSSGTAVILTGAAAGVAVETARAEKAEETLTIGIEAETTRAEGAEALLAPKTSPALTGTPTAPTAAALTDDAQIATTAYADSAVAVEKARAMTAEAAAVTTAESVAESAAAGYVAVETERAEGAETTIANGVTAETTRAEAAEALKAPLASPALTGNPTAPTQAAKDNSTKLSTTAFVDVAVGEEATARATAVTAAITTAETASDAAGTAAADVLVEKTRALAAEALLVPSSQIGADSGVMGLTAGGIGAQPPAHHAGTHAEGGSDPLTVTDLPSSVVSGSGHHVSAASLAEVEAKAAANLPSGAVYDWAIVNASTGALEDFGGGKV